MGARERVDGVADVDANGVPDVVFFDADLATHSAISITRATSTSTTKRGKKKTTWNTTPVMLPGTPGPTWTLLDR